MPDPIRSRSDPGAVRLRLPRWVVDDRFDAAMAGTCNADWRDSLPDTGLPVLAIPLLSISAWALILWGVTVTW